MLKLIIASVVLVGISFLLFAISLLFKKGVNFPNTHISGNKALAEKGITCATSQHNEAQKPKTSIKPCGDNCGLPDLDKNVC